MGGKKKKKLTSFARVSICSGFRPVYANIPICPKVSATATRLQHRGYTEASHLAGDVGPVMLAAQLLQVLLQQGTHLDDAVRHALDLAQPLLVQLRVVQDGGRDARAVDGRVGVERTDEDLDLRLHALLLLRVLADEGEGADTLAVQALPQSACAHSLSFPLPLDESCY